MITPENWKEFFYKKSEGLGTLYERVILHKFFRNLIEKYKIRKILECPSFGMTGFSGINSWFFSKAGLEVYVVDNDTHRIRLIQKVWRKAGLDSIFLKIEDYEDLPFENEEFDLVWNFSALGYLKHERIDRVLSELARISNKVIFISIPNKNVFYFLRKKFDRGSFNYINENLINRKFIEKVMKKEFSKYGFLSAEKGYFDTPPWPDFAARIDELIPFRSVEKSKNIELPEYYEYINNPEIERNILKYSFLENLPIFKSLWSHHIYWIFERKTSILFSKKYS